MTDIDKQLKDIINDFAKVNSGIVVAPGYTIDTCIAAIKAVFKDAGYRKSEPTSVKATDEWQRELDNRMTGQEWYERFKQEMPKHFIGATNSYEKRLVDGTLAECNAAAKRAAGIEGKQHE